MQLTRKQNVILQMLVDGFRNRLRLLVNLPPHGVRKPVGRVRLTAWWIHEGCGEGKSEMRRDPRRRRWPWKRAGSLRGRDWRELCPCARGSWLHDLMSDADGCGQAVTPGELFEGLVERFGEALDAWRAGQAFDRIRAAWLDCAIGLGNGSRSKTEPANARACSRGSTRPVVCSCAPSAGWRPSRRPTSGSCPARARLPSSRLVYSRSAGRPSLDDRRQRVRVRPARRLGRNRHELRPVRLWAGELSPMADG